MGSLLEKLAETNSQFAPENVPTITKSEISSEPTMEFTGVFHVSFMENRSLMISPVNLFELLGRS